MTTENAARPAASDLEAVRRRCLEAAIQAYEDAGLRGLCAEGRWECALSAIRQLDLAARPQQPD